MWRGELVMTRTNEFFNNEKISNEHYTLQITKDHFNHRLKVDDYRGNLHLIETELQNVVMKNAYAKTIINSRVEHVSFFIEEGYTLEAICRGYFSGNDAYIMTKYYEPTRRHSDKWIKEDEILSKVKKLPITPLSNLLPDHFRLRKGEIEDAILLAGLYAKVFEIYPTPLNKPDYIEEVINKGTIFYVIENDKGKIVSAASAEVNEKYHNAELTDCATLLEFRKHGLMKILLRKLELELIENQIYCSYSIARALSFGMNAAFYQLGYTYNGRLTNNCYIYDKLEDMNVWVKDLSTADISSARC